ncbi:MAG: ABC transporter permease [Clostridia bacterium]
MKAYFTEIKRTVLRTASRFFSILLIVALGAGVFAGVKSTSDDMLLTADHYYKNNNFMDVCAVSYSGLTQADADKIKNLPSVSDAEAFYTAETILSLEERTAAAKFISMPERINTLKLTEGRFPEQKDECVLVRTKNFNKLMDIGNTITVGGEYPGMQSAYKIVGTVDSPEFISFDLGSSSVGTGRLDYIIYTTKDSFSLLDAAGLFTQIAITVEGAARLDTYSDTYQHTVDRAKAEIEALLGKDTFLLDRDSNVGFVSYEADAEKIDAISKIFPVFFFLVAALVCLTTMTRMVEEERGQIGILKALGYGTGKILLKYILYSFAATVLGCILGLIVGYHLFPRAIFAAYSILYTLPAIETPFHWAFGAATAAAALLCTEIFTVAACIHTTRETPAALMLPKAPKMGKRIFLERIRPLWKRLPFIRKVTARNIFRYKKRLCMTVIGIAGCTALMLTGFGLKNSISDIVGKQFSDVILYDFSAAVNSHTDFEHSGASAVLSKYGAAFLPYYEKYVDAYAGDGSDFIHAYVLSPDCTQEADERRATFFSLHSREKSEKDRHYYSLTEDGVIITEKLAKKLGIREGDKIGFAASGGGREYFTVTAIAENYVYNYIYILPSLYEKAFGEAPVFGFFAGLLPEGIAPSGAEAEQMAAELLSLEAVTSVSFTQHTKDAFADAISSLNLVVVVLIVCAALLAVIVIYNLANVNITERIREVATIKVLGFTDREVTAYIFRESVILTLFGIAVGLVLGIWLHAFVVTTAEVEIVMFGRDIALLSYALAALLTFGFSMLVNFLMHWRLQAVSMVESLKSAE